MGEDRENASRACRACINKMKKTESTKLNNSYVSVNGSFGGNQSWFEKIEDRKHGETIRDFGCGLIAVGDIILYVTDYKVLEGGKESLNDTTYRDFILSIEKKFFHVLPKLGISGPLLAWGLNLYFFMHRKEIRKYTGSKYHARWFVRQKNLLKRIKEMLSNDIPVLFSIGPGFFTKTKVNLYDRTDEAGKLIFKPVNKTKDHYVMITGVYEGEKTMLEISSWGKRFYVSYDEYIRYVKRHDNFFFSNILYIKKKKK